MCASHEIRPTDRNGLPDFRIVEQLGLVVIETIATQAGCKCARIAGSHDDDSVDLTLTYRGWITSRQGRRSPSIEAQVKARSIDFARLTAPTLPFQLSRKNYDELRNPNQFTPRLLLVVLLRKEAQTRIDFEPDFLTIHTRALLLNLAGAPERGGETISVSLKTSDRLDPQRLLGLLESVSRFGSLPPPTSESE